MPPKIPIPITFNPYKHHFNFLRQEIHYWKNQSWPTVSDDIKKVGNNLTDFYTGHLSINEICTEVLHYFNHESIKNYHSFEDWLDSADWKKLTLSDQSVWLIKDGKNPECYLHIHPGKYSKHTVRVRATTLKTVLVLLIKSVILKNESVDNLSSVNRIRQEYLKLSPIKSLDKSNSQILRLWRMFRENSPDGKKFPNK